MDREAGSHEHGKLYVAKANLTTDRKRQMAIFNTAPRLGYSN